MSAPHGATMFHGVTLVDADGTRPDSWVRVDGDTITAVGSGAQWRDHLDGAPELIHAHGAHLMPGFVDLHGHGGGGANYGEDAQGTSQALSVHGSCGTAFSVASLVTNPVDVLEAQLRALKSLMGAAPALLGAHLEGPFLAPARKGAHAPQHLRHPSSDLVSRLLIAGKGVLRQITIAPELPGAMEAIERFVDAGVVVAVGHTSADFHTAREAFDRGATLVTHAFNAMNPIESRAPGPLVAAFADDRVVLELIADGVHVDPELLAMVFRIAPHSVALVTDAMSAAGAAEGDYDLGDLTVEVRDGRAVIAGTETLAGSVLTQDAALRTVVNAGVPLVDAVTALTVTPGTVLGHDRSQHTVVEGAPANLVMMSGSLQVLRVYAHGHWVKH